MDAHEVQRRDIGLIVTEMEADAAAARIRDIDVADLHRWQMNMAALPESAYSGAEDVDRLRTGLEGIP